VLSRRRWRDLVPWWAVAVHVSILGVAALQAVAVLAAHPRQLPTPPRGVTTASWVLIEDVGPASTATSWYVLGAAAAGILAVYGVVLLAVRRRAAADPEVDAILRTRSARVAVGVGIWLALGLLIRSNGNVVGIASLGDQRWWLDLARAMDGWGMLAALAVGLVAWRFVVEPPERATDPAPAR
jgi:hypothetical protein